VKTRSTTLRFRVDEFEEALRSRGIATKNPSERARLLGVTPQHYARVVRGHTRPGAEFIRGALAALPGVEFRELFDDELQGAAR